MKSRTASFTPSHSSDKSTADRKSVQSRPKSVFAILASQGTVETDAPKRKSLNITLDGESVSTGSTKAATALTDEPRAPRDTADMSLYSRPLPVYNRMNRMDSNKPSGASATTPSPTTAEPRALASVIADSVKTGEATKSRKKLPEPSNKPMFFRAAKNSRVELPKATDKIENVVKLDMSKYGVSNTAKVTDEHSTQKPTTTTALAKTQEKAVPPLVAAKPTKPGASLTRKESLKDKYNALQVGTMHCG